MIAWFATVVFALGAWAWTAAASQPGAMLGWSVAAAGDINGDGRPDILVGAPGYDGPQTDEGRVFLYLGGPGGLPATPSWWAEANQDAASLGAAVAGAGDVDGDGFDDLLAGASVYDNGQLDEGAAFLWLGGPGGPGRSGKPLNAAWSAEGNQPGAFQGYSLAGAGDVNADGFADVVVGAWGFDTALPNAGRIQLFLGSGQGLGAQPAVTIHGDQAGGGLGFAVAAAGDVNGDGFDDVIVGARGHDTAAGADAGRVLLFAGAPGGIDPTPVWELAGDQPFGELGYSVAGAGDVNGDGLADLVVGERGRNGAEGRALVFLGGDPASGLSLAWTGLPEPGYALYGYSVAVAGDVNGDGYDDVVVGADGWSGPLHQQGRIYLYAGSPAGPGLLPVWTAEGLTHRAFLGRSVAGAGDVDGDGLADLLAGSDGDATGGAYAGRAMLFTGSP